MRFRTGYLFLFMGLPFIYSGITILAALYQLDCQEPTEWLWYLVMFFLGVLMFAGGLFVWNEVVRVDVNEEGMVIQGLIWKKGAFRWDDVRELGVGWTIGTHGSYRELYISLVELDDRQRWHLPSNRKIHTFRIQAIFSRYGKATEGIKAAIVKYCPGPKPPEFYYAFTAGKNAAEEEHLTYVLRKKNPEGEMEYSMHVVPMK